MSGFGHYPTKLLPHRGDCTTFSKHGARLFNSDFYLNAAKSIFDSAGVPCGTKDLENGYKLLWW